MDRPPGGSSPHKTLLINPPPLPHRVITAAGVAQAVQRLSAEQMVAGSISGAAPLFRVLELLRNDGILPLLCKQAMAVLSPVGDVKNCPQLAVSC